MAGYSGESTEVVMGIRDKAKKKVKQLLPIVGAGGNQAPTAASAAPSRPAVAPTPPPAAPPRDVQSFLDEVVKTNLVVLFMKGTPSSPMCGFSANAAGILQSYGGSLFHVDVIADPEVRQGIKEYSNWPTLLKSTSAVSSLGAAISLCRCTKQASSRSLSSRPEQRRKGRFRDLI